MKIKRNVNGQEMEFELTHHEHMNAYYEWRDECDKEDVQTILDEMELSVTDEQLVLMVDRFRDCMSTDDTWRYCAENAIHYVLKNNK